MKPDFMMSEGGEMPPAAPSSPGEVCVPLKALAMPEENEEMANPEPGDPVTFQVEGKVTRVEGEMAYVQPTSVNGEPIAEKAAEEKPAEDQGDKEYAALQGEAERKGFLG